MGGGPVTETRIATCPLCTHPATSHRPYDDEDPYPRCCRPGCRCGAPGHVSMQRHAAGEVTVLHADPVLEVEGEVWSTMGWKETEPFALDTAGLFRYAYLRRLPGGRVLIGRVR